MTAFEKWLLRFNKDHTTLVWSDKLLHWAFNAGYRAGKRYMLNKVRRIPSHCPLTHCDVTPINLPFAKGDKVNGFRIVRGQAVGQLLKGEVTCAGPKAFTVRWNGPHGAYWNCFKQDKVPTFIYRLPNRSSP